MATGTDSVVMKEDVLETLYLDQTGAETYELISIGSKALGCVGDYA